MKFLRGVDKDTWNTVREKR